MAPTTAASPEASCLDASKLTYSYTTAPRDVPSEATIRSSDETVCTDHMIVASWTAREGWAAPELKPFGPFSLLPTASCLHYAHECFEGLKAYRGYDSKVRLFRPNRNARRLQMSAARIALPTVDDDALEKLMMAVLSVDCPKWLPQDRPGKFLYVRPTIIGTNSQLGIQSPTKALLYIIVGYMPRMDMPAGGKRLLTSPEDTVRSWVGGFGYAKVGANYGPSVNATRDAYNSGFHQILWLYGSQGECTEAGGSNFFVVWKRKDGRKELVTAPLDDRLILDGVTRRSCLELAKERLGDQVEVSERKFTIDELFEAAAENRIVESFAAGTAWFICPISLIHHRGREIAIPMGPDDTPGEITGNIKNWLGDIMYGRTEHEWGVVVPEKN
ncbi:branched-chain amino acid aminotransferase II [Aspergillus affinis]|uniref:branched-chain amino acid aminotransferase II n=1 Tax=Aspergillus affinis TaxID=1070780 RepID=UPI0022FDC2E1|nr:branched-chain amino acid aminotransferase II [Aspergillus affinis]KAI9045592.1 branched-chain amino acid aminotransferase II [Aspergillus affinis]